MNKLLNIAVILLLSALTPLAIAYIQHYFWLKQDTCLYLHKLGFPLEFHLESASREDGIQGINGRNLLIDLLIWIAFYSSIFFLFKKMKKDN